MTDLPSIEELEAEPSKDKDYFLEKAQQIEPSSLEAFGIKLSSRYGKAHELIEMIEFAKVIANDRGSQYIKEVFYDSKASMCRIELHPAIHANHPIGQKAAKKSISCFELFDYCQCAFLEV